MKYSIFTLIQSPNRLPTMRILLFTLCAVLLSSNPLFADKSLKGYPDGHQWFSGTFTGLDDGYLVMKRMGEKYLVKLNQDTPIIGQFRSSGPLIDREKGVINYLLLQAPTGHPLVKKVSKKNIATRKLGANCHEDGAGRHHKHISGWKPGELDPYGDVLEVVGTIEGNVITAHTVFFEPVLDCFEAFDKSLPSVLNIGDSISLGYGGELRRQSEGKLNIDHPRLNCAGIHINPVWFGAYDEPGREWDIVAFNGGHWNSNLPKEEYMELFEVSLNQSIKAGRQVIWITTAPVPFGYNVADKGTTNGVDAILPEDQWRSIQFAHPNIQNERCGRQAGRMMAQNHWVKPILDKYPQVAVCDQWGLVYARSKSKASPFATWMHGKNVHFKSTEMNEELAGMIVELSLVLTGTKSMEEVPERFRKFLHASPETYNPPADFDNPTPLEQRYRFPGQEPVTMTTNSGEGTTTTPTAKRSSKEDPWWTRPEYRLDATVVNYAEAEGRSAERRAKNRIALAEKDLKQHEQWLDSGEVPVEQVEKARLILEHAKQVHEGFGLRRASAASASSDKKTSPIKASAPTVDADADPLRTFTDNQGRRIEAEVVEVAGDTVVLRMKGRNYTISLSRLSLDDREYLRQWNAKAPASVPSRTKASPSSESAASTSVRTFTDTAGGKVEAELIAVAGDKVTLRINKRNLIFPLAKFSTADRGYIKQWSVPPTRSKTPTPDPVKEMAPDIEAPIQLGKKINRSDEEALKHLDPKWHDVQPLPETFPADFKLPLTGIVDSGTGESYDFNQPISSDVLARLQAKGKEAMLHRFYFAPRDPRYKAGPGLSGREYLEDAKNGTVREDLGHVAWIYGELKMNLMADYWLYRITKDSWFLEDIMAFADANQTMLEQNSKLFLPNGQRETGTFDHRTGTQIQHVHAHFISARLLMERVMANGGKASDPDYLKAKQYFDFAWGLVGEEIMGPAPETYGRPKNGKPAPTFTPGPSYNYILETFDIPEFLAFKIEYEPWNGSASRYLPLVHAALAAEDLHRVSGEEKYLTLSQTLQRFVQAYMHMFQKGNHCVIDKEGQPYIWVYHTPGRDSGNRENPQGGFFRGHPIFGGEDNGHSGAMARNLPYVWEAGPRFGCSTALMAAYANSMAEVLHNPSSRKNGKVHFRSPIDSPWTRAKHRPYAAPGKHPGTLYVECLAFSPDLLSGIRSWHGKDQNYDMPKANRFDLQVEVSRYLYQEWKKRSN